MPPPGARDIFAGACGRCDRAARGFSSPRVAPASPARPCTQPVRPRRPAGAETGSGVVAPTPRSGPTSTSASHTRYAALRTARGHQSPSHSPWACSAKPPEAAWLRTGILAFGTDAESVRSPGNTQCRTGRTYAHVRPWRLKTTPDTSVPGPSAPSGEPYCTPGNPHYHPDRSLEAAPNFSMPRS